MELTRFPQNQNSGELVRRNNGTESPPPVQYVNYYPPGTDLPEEPISFPFLKYWKIIRLHKWTIILIALLGAIAGILVTLPQTPIYRAEASIELQSLNQNFLNMKDIDPTEMAENSSSDTYVRTQLNILKNRMMLVRVIKKLNLEKRPEFYLSSSTSSNWRKALGVKLPKPISVEELAVRKATANLSVKIPPQTRIVQVAFDSEDPQLASDFANTLASEFIEQNLESRWTSTEHTGEFLTRQLKDLKIKLENSEDQLQSYARATGLMFTSEKDSVAEEKLRQVQQELSKAQGDRAEKQAQYEMARTWPAETLAQVLSDPTLKELQVKLAELRRQSAELGAVLTPANSKVERVTAQIQEIDGAINNKRADIVSRVRNDYQAALRREKLLEVQYNSQVKMVSDQSEKAIHYNILKREVDTNRQVYEAILQRMKEAGVAAAMRASNIRIVDPAVPPSRPYKPNVQLASGLGLVFGLLVGIGIVLVRQVADRTLQEPNDASLYLNIVELGVIPSAKSKQSKGISYGQKMIEGVSPTNGNGSGNAATYRDRLELVTWDKKTSVLAESFQATITSILFAGQEDSRARVLLFTSPSPGEGKSTIVSNIGIALAELGRRVLLIDADMRRPRLHTIYNLDNKSGFSDLLRDTKNKEQRLVSSLVRETEIPGLWVLPSGFVSNSTQNLLYSPRAAELLLRFRNEFDMVLIDTPPMLHISDARVLGRLVDGVILVLRLGKTTRDQAAAARQRFAADGTFVMGAILNDWDQKKSTGYSSYGDAYSHYYAKTT